MKQQKEITIGELNSLFEKYGNLGYQVETPYGYHDIEWCGITEKDADVYYCEVENGLYVEGADKHRLKKENGDFVTLEKIKKGEKIQTKNGISSVKEIKLQNFKDTLYDIQVANVQQYYSNGIVSHNTTLTVDSLLFLFFGKTTKTKTFDQIFNLYSDDDIVSVKGYLNVDGDDYVIERLLERKGKRIGGYAIFNHLNFYEILPNGEERSLKGEDRIKTEKKITEFIGDYEDFKTTIVTTNKNMLDLVESKPTERGRIFTKFIGVDILREKETIGKEFYNEWRVKSKISKYDIAELKEENEILENNILETENIKKGIIKRLEEESEKLKMLENEHNEKLSFKYNDIDQELLKLNQSNIIDGINFLKAEISNRSENLKVLKEEHKKSKSNVAYDPIKFKELNDEERSLLIRITKKEEEITRLEQLVIDLENGEFCPTCKRTYDDIDNTEEIEKHNKQIFLSKDELKLLNNNFNIIKKDIEKWNEIRQSWEKYEKEKLNIDRKELEIDQFENNLKKGEIQLKEYNSNKDKIEKNRELETMLFQLNMRIENVKNEKENILIDLTNNENEIKGFTNKINSNNNLINEMVKEEKIDSIFKLYIEIFGKNGISKLVLATMVPIINSYLKQILHETATFSLKLELNERNELDFYMIDEVPTPEEVIEVKKHLYSGSGYEQTVGALALRCVLSKVCALPKPNIMVFDEVFGMVAQENLALVGYFFEKIKEYFEHIFIISHNPYVKEWGNNYIEIEKRNNLSLIKQ